MKIGVPRETKNHEHRVGLTPGAVREVVAHGHQVIVEAGGRVIVQDEASSVVWGMPGAVAQAGYAEAVKPLKDLSQLALRMMMGEAA